MTKRGYTPSYVIYFPVLKKKDNGQTASKQIWQYYMLNYALIYLLHIIFQVFLFLAFGKTSSQIHYFPFHVLSVLVPLSSLLLQPVMKLEFIVTDSFCLITTTITSCSSLL